MKLGYKVFWLQSRKGKREERDEQRKMPEKVAIICHSLCGEHRFNLFQPIEKSLLTFLKVNYSVSFGKISLGSFSN